MSIYLTRGATWDVLHLVRPFGSRATVRTECGQEIAPTHPIVKLDDHLSRILADSGLCRLCQRVAGEER